MDLKIELIIQISGVLVMTILTLFLRRSLNAIALKYWTVAWLALFFGLICHRLGYEQNSGSLYNSLYFFGQYVFGFMLVAGCLNLKQDFGLHRPPMLLLAPLGFMAIGLSLATDDFNEVFNIHSAILSVFFASAFFWLRKSEIRGFGRQLMQIAVGLLTLKSLFYFVMLSARPLSEFAAIAAYDSFVDLALQIALGFGMTIVSFETALADVQTANKKLEEEHSRLEELVHTDPLTAAFNRHAFYGFVKMRDEDDHAVSGCVGFFDIDDLKGINDRFGHAAGDIAIRSVARAIREIIRAEDLIYRWGGDEFFVILVGMDSQMATKRMTRLDELLVGIRLENVQEAINLGVSFGFTDFADTSDLEKAIQQADAEMYRRKQERKGRGNNAGTFISQSAERRPSLRLVG